MRKRTNRIFGLLMTLVMVLGMFPAMTSPVHAAEPADGGRITPEEADMLLAGAGTSLVEIALENKLDDINTNENGLCGGSSHLQGICVDEKLEYMYFSYTTALAKVDIATGELVASVINFGPGSFNVEGGAHLGCLDYYDGHVYGSLEYKQPGKKFFLAIFDTDEMTEVGMDVNKMAPDQKVVTGVLLSEPTLDFRDPVDTEIFSGQDEYGHATNEKNNGHRFACSGIDGVTMGKWPGGDDDEIYMIVAYGVYAFSDINRYDNTYNVLQFYKLSDIWSEENNTWNIPFNGQRGLKLEISDGEMLASAKTLHVYTGNTSYGAQNLEYEWDTGDIVLYTYNNTDGFGGSMYVVDGSQKPEYKTLELGQNNTLADEQAHAYAKSIADAYATDDNENGVIDPDEYMKGNVAVLKCICGDRETHGADQVGDAEWGTTGVKKADQPICSSVQPAASTTGIAWIGPDPLDHDSDYFFIANGSYSTGLYKRTMNSKGVSFRQIKWLEEEKLTADPILHWTMDAADLRDGRIADTAESGSVGYYANVGVGNGVDGRDGGAMYFDGDADALDYSRAWLSKAGVSYLNNAIASTGEVTVSYWYKPEYAGSANFTSEWAPILGMYSSNDWTLGPGRFVLVSEFRNSGLTMCMNNYPETTWPTDIRSATSDLANSSDWHQIVMTVNLNEKDSAKLTGGNGESLYRRFYIDGIEVKQERALFPENKDTVMSGITDFEIGGAPFKCWSDTNVRGRFSGWIDDVRIYNTAVTAQNAAYLMQHPPVTSGEAYELPDEPAAVPEAAYVFDKAYPADLTVTCAETVTSVGGVTENCYAVSGRSVTFSADFLMTRQPGAVTVTVNGDPVTIHVLNSDKSYPIAYYKMDSIANGKVADASGHGLDAQVFNGVTAEDGAVSFDGYEETTVQRVQVTDSDFLSKAIRDKATLSFWFKSPRIVGNNTNLVGLYGDDAQPALVAQLRDDGGERPGAGETVKAAAQTLSAQHKGWNDNVVSAGSEIKVDDTWHQMAVVYDGEKSIVYLDGAVVASGAALADNLDRVDSLVLGGAVNPWYVTAGGSKSQSYQTNFFGSMDEVLIYNADLTADEIKDLYTAGRAGVTFPLDTTGLAFLISRAEKLDGAALAEPLAAAKDLLASSDITAESLTAASERLLNTMAALTDKTALRAAVTQASAITRGNYTDPTWSALEKALADANAVLNDFKAAQSDVDAAKAALDRAVSGLREYSSSSDSTYAIVVDSVKHGEVTTDRKTASKGTKVTIETSPDKGYTLEAITVIDKNGGKLKLTEKDGKYIFTMPASKVTVQAAFMEDNSMLNFFVDVPANSYYHDAVLWAVEKGIANGTGSSTFAPDTICTRAQALTFLWRAMGSHTSPAANPFTDVAEDAYYRQAVLWAVEGKITEGTGNALFSPLSSCTRAQLVTFLYRCMGK
ncbi:MAG: LamG-like jellyroll fold domain-containing protein [Lachnospirales bacterium]